MKRPDAVLFDLDGVIVDSRVPFVRCVNAALTAHGLPARPESELYRYLGPPLYGTFEELAGPGPIAASCVEAYRTRYRALAAEETTVFPGMRELLELASSKLPLVVATSKAAALAEPLLGALGLRALFDAVIGPSLEATHEGKGVTIERALATLTSGSEVVMVGDRHYDVEGASEHGIPTVGVLWGIGTAEELREAGAEALVGSPAELMPLLGLGPAAAGEPTCW
ncbi:MAG TPA: HAD hydrolase-like protein [Solirubrobacteraceae bacterium]|nr:HAD hydrolase-like protein [Solirubrobacteraceae bacterium]